MGGISDKTALLIKGSFQSSNHLVKDEREGAHLVIGWRHRNTLMQIFSPNLTSGIGKMVDGPKGAASQPVAYEGADGENKGDHDKQCICYTLQRHMEPRERLPNLNNPHQFPVFNQHRAIQAYRLITPGHRDCATPGNIVQRLCDTL